jgi:hypothetical protein
MKAHLGFLLALVLISAAFASDNYVLALLGGAIYGVSVIMSERVGLNKLSAAVQKAGMTEEFKQFLNRVHQEIDK